MPQQMSQLANCHPTFFELLKYSMQVFLEAPCEADWQLNRLLQVSRDMTNKTSGNEIANTHSRRSKGAGASLRPAWCKSGCVELQSLVLSRVLPDLI